MSHRPRAAARTKLRQMQTLLWSTTIKPLGMVLSTGSRGIGDKGESGRLLPVDV